MIIKRLLQIIILKSIPYVKYYMVFIFFMIWPKIDMSGLVLLTIPSDYICGTERKTSILS